MRRFQLFLSTLVLFGATNSGVVASPQPSPDSLLMNLTAAVEALGCYDATFELVVDGARMEGEGQYRVDGDRYSIEMFGQHIMGDGDVRYTIDDLNREVVIEPIVNSADSTPLMLLNPTTAFTSLWQYFDVELLVLMEEAVEAADESRYSEIVGGNYHLKLTPKPGDAVESLISGVVIGVDKESYLPRSVVYVAEDEVVAISILDISSSDDGVEIDYPADYDVIDIR